MTRFGLSSGAARHVQINLAGHECNSMPSDCIVTLAPSQMDGNEIDVTLDRLAFVNNSRQGRRTPMRNLIGRRELLGAGIGLCASLVPSSAVAQSTEKAPREPGTDALGRRM